MENKRFINVQDVVEELGVSCEALGKDISGKEKQVEKGM